MPDSSNEILWAEDLAMMIETRAFYKERIAEINMRIWNGTRAVRAIGLFIYAFGYCGSTIGGPDRPDSLKCQLRLGHPGKHRGANAVTWNYS